MTSLLLFIYILVIVWSVTPLKRNKRTIRDICYEWKTDTGLFTPRKLNVDLTADPPFNRKRGILPGEDGGRHVLKNITIPPPVLSAAQKAGQEFLNEDWTYTSTEGQDKLVIQLLQGKRNGFFIDVGARYWNKGSNSFSLEYYYDWKGICVEPDERMYTGLVVNRTCTVICENPIDTYLNQSVYFNYQIGGYHRTGSIGSMKVTVTLKEILSSFKLPSIIDYLSLDIEGHEYQAMLSVDLNQYTFLIISVERPPPFLHLKLTYHGYSWLTQLPGYFGEMIYIHHSLNNFTNVMNAYRPSASSYYQKSDNKYFHEPPWPKRQPPIIK